VLDLYAGAGTLGIECLSRGAARCVFVDTHRAACRVIQENLEELGFSDVAAVVCQPALAALAGAHRLVAEGGPYDLVFADPPYAIGAWPDILAALARSPVLSRDALIVVEHSSRTPTPSAPDGIKLVRQSTYGDTGLSFYEFS
jgi:16S rRNA (guanine966-N2)-methyltransferase